MLAAVQQNGGALEYASAELKGDHKIVLVAVAQSAEALQYASDELGKDGFRLYLADFIKNVFNVPEFTFFATILFGAKGQVSGDNSNCVLRLLGPSEMKRLIWEYAGVRSGEEWDLISRAAINAGVPTTSHARGPTSSPAVGKQHIDSGPACQCGIS